jgi:hypothetical protein
MMEAMQSYVTSTYYADFRKSIGLKTYKEFLEMISCAVSDRFCIGSLTDSEREALSWGISTLASVGIGVNPIVCRFARDGELLGLYSGGEIFIARSQLSCKHETLGTLIHEYSHNFGGDASLEHTASIENVWRRVSRSIIG